MLDHALSGPEGADNCERFVEAAGLKTLFPALVCLESTIPQATSCVLTRHALPDGQGASLVLVVIRLHLLTTSAVPFPQGAKKAKPSAEDTEHILGLLVSLFTNLASDTAPRLRLLAKFVEGSYEKVDRLLELREEAEGRLIGTEREIDQEKKVRLDLARRPRWSVLTFFCQGVDC